MTKTWIKICGLRDAGMARVTVEAGADAVGMVFVPASPRCVSVEQAREIVGVARTKSDVQAVGLFVDEPLEHVRAVAREAGLDTVQLHGHETPEYVYSLAPLQVIRVIPFSHTDALLTDLQPWRREIPNLQSILLDAPPSASAGKVRGGSGHTVDWEALATLMHTGALSGLPGVVLAGGLTPDNVARAIATVQPHGVDVSSGVESSPGIKSEELIRRFCAAVRSSWLSSSP